MNNRKIKGPGAGAFPGFRTAALVACAILAAAAVAGCARHRHEGANTPEEFRAKFDRATQRALKKVDATEDQKAKIKPIADDLATALFGFREEHRALRSRLLTAFEAEKVDPEEVAKIREDGVALADRTSKKVSEAIVKAAAVLSPEQRRKLAEHWKKCM